jgi:hypothetical protein
VREQALQPRLVRPTFVSPRAGRGGPAAAKARNVCGPPGPPRILSRRPSIHPTAHPS